MDSNLQVRMFVCWASCAHNGHICWSREEWCASVTLEESHAKMYLNLRIFERSAILFSLQNHWGALSCPNVITFPTHTTKNDAKKKKSVFYWFDTFHATYSGHTWCDKTERSKFNTLKQRNRKMIEQNKNGTTVTVSINPSGLAMVEKRKINCTE